MSEVTGTKILVNVEEAMKALSIGRSKLLQLTYEGELPTIKVGHRRLYPLDGLARWVRDQMVETIQSRDPGRYGLPELKSEELEEFMGSCAVVPDSEGYPTPPPPDFDLNSEGPWYIG